MIKPIKYKITKTGCHECISHTQHSKQGYIEIQINKKRMLIHRYIYECYNGKIPKGLCICHTCDNTLCINPQHLFLGTISDNNKDKTQKGRNISPDNRGIKNPLAKLTEEKVILIRLDIRPYKEIAKEYGINEAYVSQIKHFKRWKHVPIVTGMESTVTEAQGKLKGSN